MREKLWNLLDKTRYEYNYYQQYKAYLEKCQMVVAITTAIVWAMVVNLALLFSDYSLLWTLLLILSGMIAIIIDKMGIANRIAALKYYLPQMSKKLDAFHKDWMQASEATEQELLVLFTKHMKRFSALADTYLQDIHSPPHSGSAEKADVIARHWAEYLS